MVSQHVTISCKIGVHTCIYIYNIYIVWIHLSSWSLRKFVCEIQTKHCLCAAVSMLSTPGHPLSTPAWYSLGFEFVGCEVHLSTAVANPGLLSAQVDTEKESMGPMCFLRVSSYLFSLVFCRMHQYAPPLDVHEICWKSSKATTDISHQWLSKKNTKKVPFATQPDRDSPVRKTWEDVHC